MTMKTKRKFIIKVLGYSLFIFAVSTILGGCSWIRSLLNPNNPPVAVIKASSTSGEACLEVCFDASQSYDPDGNEIVGYVWYFGDGTSQGGCTVVHGFDTPGNYTVTLEVTDSKGAKGTSYTNITVYEPTQVTTNHSFNIQQGTEFATDFGLTISVPPVPLDSVCKITASCDPTPSPSSDPSIQLTASYDVLFDLSSASPEGSLRPLSDAQYVSVQFAIEIPANVDPYNAVMLIWTENGWCLAPSITNDGSIENFGGNVIGKHLVIQLRMALTTVTSVQAHAGVSSWWEGFTKNVKLAIGRFINQFDCTPVYPLISEDPCEKKGQYLEKKLRVSSPERGFGGIWFKVDIVSSSNLASPPEWEPPNRFELEKVVAREGWYLSPSDDKPGVLTLKFSMPGGKARVTFDARGALSIQILEWLLRLVPFGDLFEGVAEFFWATIKELVEGLDLDSVKTWEDALAKAKQLIEVLAKKLVEEAFVRQLANHLFEKYRGRFPEDILKDASRITAKRLLNEVVKPIQLLTIAANILTYVWTLASRQAGYCEHGYCVWETMCRVMVDANPPTVTSLSIIPDSVTLGEAFTISFSVADDGGSGLKEVTLRRFYDSQGSPGDWTEVKKLLVSGNNYSGSFTDAPTSAGTYWYGLHVVDNAGNWNDEKNSNTGGSPGVYGPIKRVVTPPSPPASQAAAQIVSYSASPRQVQVGQQVTLSMTIKNTGNTSWTFYGAVSLRKPGGAEVHLTPKPLTLNVGQEGSVSWNYAPDVVGSWDVVFGVWKEASQQNSLGHTGWLTGYITVSPLVTQLPDLVVDDIWVDPDPPTPGGSTTIGVRVKNQGSADTAGEFLLELYIDNVFQGRATIKGLGAGGAHTEYWQAVRWPSDTNVHEIKGVVDPNNRVRESNEDNNVLTKQFRAQQSDIPSFNFDISLTPTSKTASRGSVISTTVRAWRTAGSTTKVAFTVTGFPVGIAVNPQSWSWDLGDQSCDVVFAIDSNVPIGTYTIVIKGTGGGVTKEAPFTLTVTQASIQLPDLVVEDIWTDPNPPFASSDVVIGVRVKNRGTADVTTPFFLKVQLLDSQGRPIYSRKESLNGLASGNDYVSMPTTTAKWPSTTDPCTIEATVDPDATIHESDESNNTLTKRVQAVSPPQPVGTLLIRSEPGEADVYVDGQYKGKTPSVTTDYLPIVNLSVGEHTVKVTKSGYNDWIGTVSISAGGTTQLTVYLSIITPPVDQLPEIIRPNPNEVVQAQVGKLFTYQIEARDPEGQPLSYVLTERPEGMVINQSTGLLQWTPSTSWSGRRAEVSFFVSDRPVGQTSGREVYRKFYIDVKEDALPVILKPQQDEVVEAQVGKAFSYQIQAYDPEQQPIAFYLQEGPPGLTIDGTGLIYWSPPSSFAGQRVKVTFWATDRGPDEALERAVYRTFYIDVKAQPSAPTITSFGVANVQAESVTLRTTINPNGSRTTVYFEWGLTTSYGNRSPEQNVEPTATNMDINFLVTNLIPDTLYHWRVVAINQFGSAYSPDLTFRTLTSGSQPPSSFDFNISVNPSSWTARQNDMTVITVHAWRTAGSTTQVTFSITGLPTGITVNPSSWSWNLGDESRTVTVSVFPNAPVGTHTITIVGTGGGRTKTATFSITVTGKFKAGDPVYVYGTGGVGLRVRDAPCGKQIGNEPDGATGVVLEGPVACSLEGKTYIWWKIRWADGLIGWSVQDYLGLGAG